MRQPFHVVIPARYAATRLPAKLLLDIAGKPMLQHTYERALASGATSVIVATDDKRIYNCITQLGGKACMTAETHQSGTERIAEVVQEFGFSDDTVVINLQGDEPLMPSSAIQVTANLLAENPTVSVATIAKPFDDVDSLFSSSCVKVVRDKTGAALYFSRAPIPWEQPNFSEKKVTEKDFLTHFHHLGIYAYRVGFLKEYVSWESGYLEKLESLEQLRVLWHGHKIQVGVIDRCICFGVDTPDDLERVRSLF